MTPDRITWRGPERSIVILDEDRTVRAMTKAIDGDVCPF